MLTLERGGRKLNYIFELIDYILLGLLVRNIYRVYSISDLVGSEIQTRAEGKFTQISRILCVKTERQIIKGALHS